MNPLTSTLVEGILTDPTGRASSHFDLPILQGEVVVAQWIELPGPQLAVSNPVMITIL